MRPVGPGVISQTLTTRDGTHDMSEYDRPTHPAAKVMAFIAFLIGLGIVVEGVNQAQSYFAGPTVSASASSEMTDGRAAKQP